MKKDSLNVALHYLKFRPRSVFEVERKLKNKKVSEGEIKKTIAVLKKNQLLDDEKFAKMWVRDRNSFRPSGSYLLKMELRKLGIAASLIEKTLAHQNEEELARQAIESKSRYRQADFQKKTSFLQRRGFGTGVIFKVISKKE